VPTSDPVFRPCVAPRKHSWSLLSSAVAGVLAVLEWRLTIGALGHRSLCLPRVRPGQRGGPSTQGYTLSLHDAVQRRIPDTKSLADLRCGCAFVGVQTPDFARLINTQSAASATVWLWGAGMRSLDLLYRSSLRVFDNGQLLLPLIRQQRPLNWFEPSAYRLVDGGLPDYARRCPSRVIGES